MADLWRCHGCGSTMAAGSKFCPGCGVKVAPPPATSPGQPPRKGLYGGAKIFFALVGLLVGAGIVSALVHHSRSSGGSASGGSASGSNIYLVASQSFCVPTGIDDLYTGDGEVTFFLAFRNSGGSDGTVDAIPVRHYDDGQTNESAMDEVSLDVPAGELQRGRTDAMIYKAHQHEVTGCGVIVDGRDEVAIAVHP